MFGPLGVPEMIFIMLLALLVFGPKRLPEIGRTLGKGIGEFRRASNELKRSINTELALEEQPEPPIRAPRIEPPPLTAARTASPTATTAGTVATVANEAITPAAPPVALTAADPVDETVYRSPHDESPYDEAPYGEVDEPGVVPSPEQNEPLEPR